MLGIAKPADEDVFARLLALKTQPQKDCYDPYVLELQMTLRSIQRIVHPLIVTDEKRKLRDYRRDFERIRALCDPIVGVYGRGSYG